MRSLSLSFSWTRLIALLLLPFFAINTLSVSIVTAASGDEYLTGSTESLVEMVAPEVWLDAALTEPSTSTGEIVKVMTDTGTVISDTGSIITAEISTGSSLTGVIETATGVEIAILPEST